MKAKLKKKHGYIAAGCGAVAVVAHVTHLPLLLLAFFGFVSAGLTQSIWFKAFAIFVSVTSIGLFVIYRSKCHKKKCSKELINNVEIKD